MKEHSIFPQFKNPEKKVVVFLFKGHYKNSLKAARALPDTRPLTTHTQQGFSGKRNILHALAQIALLDVNTLSDDDKSDILKIATHLVELNPQWKIQQDKFHKTPDQYITEKTKAMLSPLETYNNLAQKQVTKATCCCQQ